MYLADTNIWLKVIIKIQYVDPTTAQLKINTTICWPYSGTAIDVQYEWLVGPKAAWLNVTIYNKNTSPWADKLT